MYVSGKAGGTGNGWAGTRHGEHWLQRKRWAEAYARTYRADAAAREYSFYEYLIACPPQDGAYVTKIGLPGPRP